MWLFKKYGVKEMFIATKDTITPFIKYFGTNLRYMSVNEICKWYRRFCHICCGECNERELIDELKKQRVI